MENRAKLRASAVLALALLIAGCVPGGGGYGYRPVYVQPSGPYYQPLTRTAPSYAAPLYSPSPLYYPSAPPSNIGDGNPWNNRYSDGQYHGYVAPRGPAGLDGALPPPGGYGGLDAW